eukprot:Nk52_evm5s123 gene=Nk52_evmTU5s123
MNMKHLAYSRGYTQSSMALTLLSLLLLFFSSSTLISQVAANPHPSPEPQFGGGVASSSALSFQDTISTMMTTQENTENDEVQRLLYDVLRLLLSRLQVSTNNPGILEAMATSAVQNQFNILKNTYQVVCSDQSMFGGGNACDDFMLKVRQLPNCVTGTSCAM